MNISDIKENFTPTVKRVGINNYNLSRGDDGWTIHPHWAIKTKFEPTFLRKVNRLCSSTRKIDYALNQLKDIVPVQITSDLRITKNGILVVMQSTDQTFKSYINVYYLGVFQGVSYLSFKQQSPEYPLVVCSVDEVVGLIMPYSMGEGS